MPYKEPRFWCANAEAIIDRISSYQTTLFFFYKGRNGTLEEPELFIHFCFLSHIWFPLLIPQNKASV